MWRRSVLISAALVFGTSLLTATVRADEVREYGEYLAGECTTCHRIDGVDNGIPAIVGWDIETFKETLGYYKTGERDNPAMVSVVKSLDDEQIHALATYFASLTPKETE